MVGQDLNAGLGAVAVQVAGDGNSVTISLGGTSLTLERRHRLSARRAKTDLQLLLTELREIDLVGRDTELAQLREWLDSNSEISVRCLTGQAGAGKTRLGIELCERAETEGWRAGFVRLDGLDQDLSGWHWCDPTLVVVDYAAASAHNLRRWLEALAKREAGVKKLRLLLLERYVTKGVGWWDEVFGGGGMTGFGPADLLDPPAPIPLTSLASAVDRRKLLAQVMTKAAALNKISPAPQPPALGADPAFDRQLAEDRLEHQPLFLAMAGVVAVSTNAPSALALSRTDLAERVARGAEGRLKRLAREQGVDSTLLTHLAACVTLQNGCDREAAEAMVKDERAAMDWQVGGSAEHLTNVLRSALPMDGSVGIDAIRPDLVGEAFLLREFGRNERPISKQAAIVERAFTRVGLPVVRTVVRTAQDYCAGIPDHASLRWLDHLIGLIEDPFGLIRISDELPWQTVGLRERAAHLQAVIVTKLRATVLANPELAPHLAYALRSLATRLSALGDHEAAFDAAWQATDLYRVVVAHFRRDFRPDLAKSLEDLSNCLREIGKREAAFTAAREAADLYRALATERPDAFRSNLAGTFNNVAVHLSALGEHEFALKFAREAANHYRALAAQHPDVFRPDLAGTLNTLANRLSNLGEHEAALNAAREAAELHRILAAQRPDAFRPDLAGTLNNLAIRLNALGNREATLNAAREATDLYRALAAQRPDASRPDLAMSLGNLAAFLNALGEREAALNAVRESVNIRRVLAAQRPDAFRPDLAISLRVLADCLESEDLTETLAANVEACQIHASLFLDRPALFASQMAKTVNDYTVRCTRAGQKPDMELLAPIIAAFETLQASQENPQP